MSEDLAAVFGAIYANQVWGAPESPADRFYSGSGAHTESIVGPYVGAVRSFLRLFEMFEGRKADLVDLGCGDFHIGSRIRSACGRYVACDVVADLIAFNAEKLADQNVEFRQLDFTRDALPDGDVVHIRQVLQHLSNADIARFLAGIPASFRYMILTEHLPSGQFFANLDKPSGHGIRLSNNSGVVLTRPPFNLAPIDEVVLSDAPELSGVIRTSLYRLK
jgi:hypothetical protein